MGGSELEMENDAACMKSASQPQLDAISNYNDLDLGTSSTQTPEVAKPQHVKHPNKRASLMSPPYLNLSSASLAESATYPVSHQYHYIQYFQPPLQRSGGTPAACHCHCTCRTHLQHANSQQLTQPQCAIASSGNIDGQMEMAVSVLVHQSSAGATSGGSGGTNKHSVDATQSGSHAYQALLTQNANSNEDKPLNVICNCGQECNCAAAIPPKKKPQFGSHGVKPDTVLGADEITVSESDNNSTMRKKRKGREGVLSSIKSNSWCAHNHAPPVDYYSDGVIEGLGSTIEEMRPPLPPRPRPPPRPRNPEVANNSNHRRVSTGIKKYVIWCLICGGFSCLLGILFLGVYFLLHSYTITVGNFETVPTFVPATLLILTGVCIISLARRKNRYSYLIKLSGACGLISALTCALVTVTTTVLHMSRLQSLRECEYAQKTRTCTCYSDLLDSQVDRVDKGVRLVFDSLSDCGVVHGSLYSCLRAIFGLSVAGVLIAVFSCMLVYQLLSHERKKMYWEQLELRCRSLYTSQQGRPSTMGATPGAICRCCEQCHAHRQLPIRGSTYPWDDGGEPRFWASQPPGNFYSPNPGGEDMNTAAMCRAHCTSQTRSRTTGWSWPRMPWQRSSPDAHTRFRQTPSSPDSQYGFSNNMSMPQQLVTENGPSNAAPHFNIVPNGGAYGVWGPPPPYSDPNSPARRNYYQYIQQNPCNNTESQNMRVVNIPNAGQQQQCPTQHTTMFVEQFGGGTCCVQNSSLRNSDKRDYRNTPSDSDGAPRDRFSHTLPTRKLKKRVETGAKLVGMHSPQAGQRINVRQVFPKTNHRGPLHEPQNSSSSDNANLVDLNESRQEQRNNRYQNAPCDQVTQQHRNRDDGNLQQNDSAAEKQNKEQDTCDPAESEVYFADVSSCCNVSVKNDNYYEDASQETLVPPGHQSDTDFECFQDNKQNMRRQAFASDCNVDMKQPQHIPKDLSHQSMCSVLSEPKTEFTDLSPSTPCSNKLITNLTNDANENVTLELDGNSLKQTERIRPPPSFVASLPYSSESQCLEAHRRSTKNMQETLLTPEAHYEVINDTSNIAISPKIRHHSSNSSSGSSQRATHYGSGRCQERSHKNHHKAKAREQADSFSNSLVTQSQRQTPWSDLNGKINRQCL